LRTPLNALVGFTHMLKHGSVQTGEQPRVFEILERNASLLTRLVDDMLDVASIISGKTKLNVHPVVLSQLIDHAVAMITPTAAAKGVVVTTELDRSVAPLTADSDRLHQVLWNLLANAVKFTARGGSVRISLESLGEFVEIVVADTGSGITASFLPYVFDRFRQSEREASGRQGGLGLGLAISRHLVEMHGGAITAASEGEGKGATFRIVLPYNVAVPAHAEII
jgi:signal transduction histidine kinase